MIAELRALLRRRGAMTATQAHQALADGAVLIDVREPREWRAGHAPQARHVVLSQLPNHLAEMPTDIPIVTVCRSGRRSSAAASLLTQRGYQATNLTGGMTAWVAAGLPVVTDDNKPGQII